MNCVALQLGDVKLLYAIFEMVEIISASISILISNSVASTSVGIALPD